MRLSAPGRRDGIDAVLIAETLGLQGLGRGSGRRPSRALCWQAQMLKNLVRHLLLSDQAAQLPATAAALAMEHVDGEGTPQQGGPVRAMTSMRGADLAWRDWRRGRCRLRLAFGRAERRSLLRRRLHRLRRARSTGDDSSAMLTMGGEHAMEANQMSSGRRNQGGDSA